MSEPSDVMELDAEIDRARLRRDVGSPVGTLMDTLASFDELEWPDRDAGGRIVAALGDRDSADPDKNNRSRSTRIAVATGLATLAVASVLLILLVVGPAPSRTTRSNPAPSAGLWRLAGYYEPPTWQQTGQTGPLGPMTCPSTTVCYIVNAEFVPTDTELRVTLFALSVSHDHGSTWSNLPLTGLTSFTTGLSCPDSKGQICLAGGMQGSTPALLSTEDGGRSWTGHALPPNAGHLAALACTNRRHCVGTFTANENAFAQQGNAQVTSDGGAQWAPVSTKGDLLNTIACKATTCVADGEVPGATPDALGTPATLYSNDAGATWGLSRLPAGVMTDAYQDQFSCPSKTVCWAIGYGGSAALATSGAIMRSTDGGATWSLSPTPPSTTQLYFAISCPNAKVCWIGGGGGPYGGSSTGGAHVNPDGTKTLVGATGPLLWHTVDGGKSWDLTVIKVTATVPDGLSPSSLAGIGQLVCPTADLCIAAGQGDGGSRYTATYSNAPLEAKR